MESDVGSDVGFEEVCIDVGVDFIGSTCLTFVNASMDKIVKTAREYKFRQISNMCIKTSLDSIQEALCATEGEQWAIKCQMDELGTRAICKIEFKDCYSSETRRPVTSFTATAYLDTIPGRDIDKCEKLAEIRCRALRARYLKVMSSSVYNDICKTAKVVEEEYVERYKKEEKDFWLDELKLLEATM